MFVLLVYVSACILYVYVCYCVCVVRGQLLEVICFLLMQDLWNQIIWLSGFSSSEDTCWTILPAILKLIHCDLTHSW